MNTLRRMICCSGNSEDYHGSELTQAVPHKKRRSSKNANHKSRNRKDKKSDQNSEDLNNSKNRASKDGRQRSKDIMKDKSYQEDKETQKQKVKNLGEERKDGDSTAEMSSAQRQKLNKINTNQQQNQNVSGATQNNDKIQGQQPSHSQNNKQQLQQEEIKDDEQARKQREKDQQLNQLSQDKMIIQQKEERKRVMLEKAPLLEMKLVEGNGLKNKHSFKINAMGLITSQREDCDDHYVYFGSAKDMNGKIVNDVVCEKEDQFAEQHFYIRYDKYKNGYFIKDLGLGTGTFLKVSNTQHSQLRNGQIVIFGENQMVVGITHGKNKDKEAAIDKYYSKDQASAAAVQGLQSSRNDIIFLKFIDGPNKNKQFEFKSSSAPLMIGRTDKCKVKFTDTSLSRYQCILDFINDKWLIRDGDGTGKGSTNGTWMFCEEEVKIECTHNLIKAGLSIFQIDMVV
eukprot:403347135